MRRIFVVFVALFTFDVMVSFAKKSETVTLQEESGVIVKARSIKGSVDELFAVGEFNATPEDVFSLLWDIPSHSKFMAPIKEATKISEGTTSRVDHIIFHAILPGLKDRDVVSKTTITERTNARIKLQFKQTDAEGPSPSKDLVRLALREGGWDLVAIEGGQKTRATYRLHTDPGVEIAQKIAQSFAAKGIIEVYEAIREELKQ